MSKRILIVDDSNLMRYRIAQCLTDAGYEVVGKAIDGDDAVRLYNQLLPDIVTMDITMRGKDGITAAQEILALHPDASIIFYTLLDSAASVMARLKAGSSTKLIRKGDEEALLKTLAAMA
ncbi:MAG TPA: response regulator [Syntrophobacteraceae bacterium]|nr:response regulator [Syntrophobacteraceae bacterium]